MVQSSLESQVPLFSNFSGNTSALSSRSWILDTRARHHLCHDISCFECFANSKVSHVSLPNGSTVVVSNIGKVRLSKHIVLDNVLFIPSFKYSLISVSSLTKQTHCSCMFLSTHCIIQNLIRRTVRKLVISATSSTFPVLVH